MLIESMQTQEVVALFALFDVDLPAVVNRVGDMARGLEVAKKAVADSWKKKAFELHPDRNGGDDKAFKVLVAARDTIPKIGIQPPPRMVVKGYQQVVATVTYSGTGTGSW